jgi:hypothetical protein
MTTPAGVTPTPIDWANLIQAGRDLLNPQQGGQLPTHEHVRRSASNAYYAMFHSLAYSNATALVGSPSNPTTAAAWSRIYRGLDHTTARRELLRNRRDLSLPAQNFTNAFADLQQRRHSADYDPNAVITIDDGAVYLNRAESAILDFAQITLDEQVHIATLTLVRSR